MIYKGDDLNTEIEVITSEYDADEYSSIEVDISDYVDIGNTNIITDNLHDEQKLELFLDNINDIRLE